MNYASMSASSSIDIMTHYIRTICIISIALLMHSCFTGVESTPRISAGDVKKEKIKTTPEQRFLSDLLPQPPSEWQPGKLFFVTDPKISIIFTSQSSPDKENISGTNIAFQRMYPVTSVTGEEVTELEFVSPNGGHLFYRDNTPFEKIPERQQLDIPFTIEQDLVQQARNLLIGNQYYVTSPLWYMADGTKSVNGLRHIPVTIVDVMPGNTAFPLRVVFKPEDSSTNYSVYMSVGNVRTSTRNFHTLFAFENPRKRYPDISDEHWKLIMHSRVTEGMTRDECRLALGSPQTIGQRPGRAGMVEYWSYSDGIYLLFEEGYLTFYRK